MSVYWESQGQDKLCGVHCINTLLQGPYFDEFKLAKIAQVLDAQEKEIMMQGGFESNEFLNYIGVIFRFNIRYF